MVPEGSFLFKSFVLSSSQELRSACLYYPAQNNQEDEKIKEYRNILFLCNFVIDNVSWGFEKSDSDCNPVVE